MLRTDNPLGNTGRARAPGYAMADVNAAHRFSTWLDATLKIQNVGNFYRNDVQPSNPVAGRQSQLGFRAKL